MLAVLRALIKKVPAVLILGLLVALAWLGHANEWKIPAFATLWGGTKEEEENDDEDRTIVQPDPLVAACGMGYVFAQPALGPRIIFPSEEAVAKTGLETAPAEYRGMEVTVAAVGELEYDRTRYAVLAPRAAGTVREVFVRAGDSVKQGNTLSLVEAAEVGRAKAEFLNSLAQVETRSEIYQGKNTARGSIPEREINEAKANLREARIKLFNDHQALINYGLPVSLEEMQAEMQRLKTDKEMEEVKEKALFRKIAELGVPESMRNTLGGDGMTANMLPLVAPFDGVIVSSRKARGEAVGPAEPQFVLADPGKLWLVLNVRPDEASKLELGRDVFFRAAGMRDEAKGKLAWISPEADDRTRVVLARADIDNPGGKLRPHTFGAARIVTESKPDAVTVPDAAVQFDEGTYYVFVQRDATTYQTRRVKIGGRQNGFTEIVAGVAVGETVVTQGSYVLKSELFRDRIGGEE